MMEHDFVVTGIIGYTDFGNLISIHANYFKELVHH